MKSIQAGIIKDLLNTIKKLSEGLFNYLGGSDLEKSKTVIDEKNAKKINDRVFELPCKYNGGTAPLPYTLRIETIDENLANIEVIYKEGSDVKKANRQKVPSESSTKVAEKLLLSILDNDTKEAFGIKASRTMQVTLQRITAAKATSIKLTAIKANYELAEAYSDLDTILESPEFMEAITEEPISFEVVDTGEDFDINAIDNVSDSTEYSLKQLLCAAIQFNMDIQLLRWECARYSGLFDIVGCHLYSASDWVDRLGIWLIETTNSVYNMLGECRPDIGTDADLLSEHSPCIECLGTQVIYPVFDRIIGAIENNLPNLPSDMQQQLNFWLRDLKETRDFRLKQM